MIGLRLPEGTLRILALGAHPDDVEIGCGGTVLSLCSSRQVDAAVVVMTGTPNRRAEAEHAAARFFDGATVTITVHDLPDGRLPAHWDATKSLLEEAALAGVPDVVLAPRPDDAHQDHRLLGEIVTTVWRDSLVLHYEIPKWDGDLGRATHYVPLDEEAAHRKVELLDICYPSQRGRDWWTDDTFLGLMRLRGIECRQRYAEAFVAAKSVVFVG